MGNEDWRTIKIPNELAIKIENIEKEEGFSSKSDFVTQAIRELLEKYGSPRFEHVNFHDNMIRLIDNNKPRNTPFVEIFLKNYELLCTSCNSKKCEHIEYAQQDSKINRQLKEKNVKQS